MFQLHEFVSALKIVLLPYIPILKVVFGTSGMVAQYAIIVIGNPLQAMKIVEQRNAKNIALVLHALILWAQCSFLGYGLLDEDVYIYGPQLLAIPMTLLIFTLARYYGATFQLPELWFMTLWKRFRKPVVDTITN